VYLCGNFKTIDMKTIRQILEKTITEMPNTFTSNEFGKQATLNGYPNKRSQNKHFSKFLIKYAENEGFRSKTWHKKVRKKYFDDKPIIREKIVSTFDNVEEAIKLLKSKGYKIMKPINEWVEI
jgi:hypothetical protein